MEYRAYSRTPVYNTVYKCLLPYKESKIKQVEWFITFIIFAIYFVVVVVAVFVVVVVIVAAAAVAVVAQTTDFACK